MLQNYPLFFRIYYGLLIPFFILYLSFDQGDIVIIINQNRNALEDFIAPYLTFLGDGIFAAIMCLVIITWKKKEGIMFSIVNIFLGVSIYFIKELAFPDALRPKAFFENGYPLNFIEGVDVSLYYSFPSGHASTVFALAGLLAFLFSDKKWLQITLFIVACYVSYTRMYLLQHFYQDILVGSFYGVILATIGWKIVLPYLYRKKDLNKTA